MKAIRLPPWFWELIESFGGDTALMRQQFGTMPQQRLFAFCHQYHKAKAWAHPLYWADLPSDSCPDLSEDFGDDFAAWVVSRGRQFFNEVCQHPTNLKLYLDEFNALATAFEPVRPDSIAFGTYHDRFGHFAQERF